MSIESKEILELHSIYQSMKEGPKGQDLQEVSIHNANILTRCKDNKKRVNCGPADKAWLEKQKEEGSGGPSTPPGSNGGPSTPPGSNGGPSTPPGSNGGPSTPPGSNGGPSTPPGSNGGPSTPPGSNGGPSTPPASIETNKTPPGPTGNDGPPGPTGGPSTPPGSSSDGPPGPSGDEKKVEKIDYRTDKEKEWDNKKMSKLERENRARFGDEKVDFLKQKQIDFKTWQAKSQIPGADRKALKRDFINKYPNSITAQKYYGLRDHVDWDAFDMVGSYLMDSRQADSMDEALYVMMEMDSDMIQNIVKESEFELIEARRADKKGIKRGEKGNPDTDQAPSGQQPADTKTGYRARRVERREGDKRRKANKERRGWNYGGKEAAAGDLANAQRQPDADLGSQKQVTDTGAHKDKHGWRQRVSSPASGRKSESASSEREDKRYPPSNPKHKLHGKKTKKDKPQGRYKEVKENYAAVEAIRLLIEKQNKASATAGPKNNKADTIEAEIDQIQTMPSLPDKDIKKFLGNKGNNNKPAPEGPAPDNSRSGPSAPSGPAPSAPPASNSDKPVPGPSAPPASPPASPSAPTSSPNKTDPNKTTKKPNRTNIGGRWYNRGLPDGANDLKGNENIA